MYDQVYLRHKLIDIFRRSLNFVPPDVDTDLFVEGGLDSLMFIELLAQVEREFKIEIPLEKLELDDFRSVSSIACFIAGYGGGDKTVDGKVLPLKKVYIAGGENDR